MFKMAVKWKFIPESPVQCDRPQVQNRPVNIWAPEEVQQALPIMRQEGGDMLELCIHASFMLSARKGEIGGLMWDDIDSENYQVHINKQLQRVDKDALEKTIAREKPLLVFPGEKKDAKSVLVLMSVKTKGSNRVLDVPKPFMERLMERKMEYEKQKKLYSAFGIFTDYNLVISHSTGAPVDPRRMNAWLDKFIEKHPEFREIVFHGVRHSSASYKAAQSGGDWKAVQNDMGQNTPKLLQERYAHILPGARSGLAQTIERDFYGQGKEDPIDIERLLHLVQKNPDALKKLKELL